MKDKPVSFVLCTFPLSESKICNTCAFEGLRRIRDRLHALIRFCRSRTLQCGAPDEHATSRVRIYKRHVGAPLTYAISSAVVHTYIQHDHYIVVGPPATAMSTCILRADRSTDTGPASVRCSMLATTTSFSTTPIALQDGNLNDERFLIPPLIPTER